MWLLLLLLLLLLLVVAAGVDEAELCCSFVFTVDELLCVAVAVVYGCHGARMVVFSDRMV